jgi:hypothetical protein
VKPTGTNRPCGLTIFPLLLETPKDALSSRFALKAAVSH